MGLPVLKKCKKAKLLYEHQKGICPGCGWEFSFEEMTRDHILPRSKGGSGAIGNLQLMCGPCNRRKSNILPENFPLKKTIPKLKVVRQVQPRREPKFKPAAAEPLNHDLHCLDGKWLHWREMTDSQKLRKALAKITVSQASCDRAMETHWTSVLFGLAKRAERIKEKARKRERYHSPPLENPAWNLDQ